MKHIQPGDVVFSYANSAIIAVGVVKTHCYLFPKPVEFGNAGLNWSNEGWKVDVKYRKLDNPLRTMSHIDSLRELLPAVKSPIQTKNGRGNQAYLFRIDKPLAIALANLIDRDTFTIVKREDVGDKFKYIDTIDIHIKDWEDRIEEGIKSADDISNTEKDRLIKARIGQGKFRQLLYSRESKCRITGVDKPEHLIASHIKPWRSSNNQERLDPENGFLLTPTIDHLFDKGFIGFENDGSILLADVADRNSLEKMGVICGDASVNAGPLSDGQKNYLEWHRDLILLR